MTITAAVSYGELSAMYPKAGGQYVYLQKADGSYLVEEGTTTNYEIWTLASGNTIS
jgi:amino acid transporter